MAAETDYNFPTNGMKIRLWAHFFMFPACEFLVSSETGSGQIVSSDQTKYMEGLVDCDWVIVGKPASNITLNFQDLTVRKSIILW